MILVYLLMFPLPAFMAMLGLLAASRKLDKLDDNYKDYYDEIRFYRLVGNFHLAIILLSTLGTIYSVPKLLNAAQLISQLQ